MKSIALVDFFQRWHAWNYSNAARRLCTCYSGVKNLLTVSAPSVSFAHDITITHSKAVTILCHCHTASRFSAQLTDKYPVQIKDVCCCYCCIVLYCIVGFELRAFFKAGVVLNSANTSRSCDHSRRLSLCFVKLNFLKYLSHQINDFSPVVSVISTAAIKMVNQRILH